MKRKVELDNADIRHIVKVLGNIYPLASIPEKHDIKMVLKMYFDTTPEYGLKLASKSYENFLQSEEMRWKRE